MRQAQHVRGRVALVERAIAQLPIAVIAPALDAAPVRLFKKLNRKGTAQVCPSPEPAPVAIAWTPDVRCQSFRLPLGLAFRQIVGALQIQPELRRCPKRLGK